ncbi:7060_t:CDS:10 [Gigaspora margarita]|uniref:7060_t:CDS:1 n=1 Tax=Gigaspora margarita TaxID=4874 RepID=A0ABN7W4N5_GIGMA|nr:7060_t:CDS:10 [Gigaspora margarita]
MEQPSRIEYMKRGALMGGAVGVCLGFAFGTYHILRFGPSQGGYLSTLSRYMVSSAGSFALFMGIGSVIRSEQSKNIMLKQYLEQHQRYYSRGFANLPVEVLERKRWDRRSERGDTDATILPIIYSTIICNVKEIIAKESLFGLWRGAIPTIMRNVPGTALYYSTLSDIRRLFSLRHRINSSSPIPQRSTTSSSLPVLSNIENLIAGMVARGSIGFVMMPITVVKIRYESNLYKYKSIWGALSSIIKTDGIKGLFYGYGATAIKDAPTSGLNVLFYERFKLALQERFDDVWIWQDYGNFSWSANYSSSLSPTAMHMISGTFAGSMSAFITQPFDMLKTRIQLKPSEYSNMFRGASKVLKEEGFLRFFDGLTLRLGRKTMQNAIGWTLFEALVTWFQEHKINL